MSSVPLAATQIRPPEDPMAMVQRAMQLRSAVFGQDLSAAALQSKNLSNQQLALMLDSERRLNAAQNDPHFDPNDIAGAAHLYQAYGVPTERANASIKALREINDSKQAQSAQNIQNDQNNREFWDDQLNTVRSAKPEDRQAAYEEVLQAARAHANLLPDGMAKTMYLAHLNAAPGIVDMDWVNRQHLENRTASALNEEALKQAQTREAAGKGAQSEAEAANLRAKSDPSSPLFDPTGAGTAVNAQRGGGWGTAVQAGEATAAGLKAGAEAQARFPFEKQLETIRQQVAVQMSTNKDAQDKIETNVLKPYEEKSNDIAMAQAGIDQAATGNIAAAPAALFKLIGVAQPTGSHRVMQTEVEGFRKMGGVGTKIASWWGQTSSGDPWTPEMVQDVKDFLTQQQNVANKTLNRGIGDVNKLYKTNVGTGLTQAETVDVKAPDGSVHTFPDQASADKFKKLAKIP